MWAEAEIARAAEFACRLEVEAEKPGNVTPADALPKLSYRDFVASSAAVAPVLGEAGRRRIGETILRAVRARGAVTSANTNLGIILLLAPLARAAALVKGAGGAPVELGGAQARAERTLALRRALAGVLAELDVADAELAFEAIRLAAPGGIGRVASQDLSGRPTVTLLEAMRIAAPRDAVAREFATGFELTFGTALGLLEAAFAAGSDARTAAVELALELQARVPDTLIARKFGVAAAAAASAHARAVLAAGPRGSAARERKTSSFDAWLRDPARRWNPGTTADLVAAALFVWLLVGGAADKDLGADRRRTSGNASVGDASPAGGESPRPAKQVLASP
jgi:triphosphoribosyl-dephospho-CoA synthase